MSIRLTGLAALLAFASLLFVAGADAASKPQKCGGIAPVQCPSGTFCQIPAGKCGADMTGTCAKVPEVCTERYKPVCGCDNQTYSNDCKRQMAKVSKKSNGKCKTS